MADCYKYFAPGSGCENLNVPPTFNHTQPEPWFYSAFDSHAIKNRTKGGKKGQIEMGTKKMWLHAYTRVTDTGQAENGPDSMVLIPDSVTLGICVHLRSSAVKNSVEVAEISAKSG